MKLIKLELTSDYRLDDENGELIASTLEGAKTKLSKQNCDEIFGVVDVNELANQNAKKDLFNRGYDGVINAHQQMLIEVSYINGFNKAVELNKDKLFTVEDIMKAFEAGYETLESEKTYNEHYDILIQSLQQPKEIEVEICCYIGNGDKESDSFKDPLVTNTGIPKLDEDGCLILKKK